MRRLSVALLAILLLVGVSAVARGTDADVATIELREFTLGDDVAGELRLRWLEQLRSKYGEGSWAPMRMELGDDELALMGLPPADVLRAHRYDEPTAFADGEPRPLRAVPTAPKGGGGGNGGGGGGESGSASTQSPGVATYAGAGWFGIRPGAWLLLLDGGVGWCTMAHVYGAPGSYEISTAGHCGEVGDRATMIGVVGNNTPVLIDFGTFSKSTGDGGIGRDWALIKVKPEYQHLVSPTMAFWGGPIGMFTKTGTAAGLTWSGRSLVPTPVVNADPLLVQEILHYGHGTGLGQGVGTPRTGTALDWRSTYFTFFGAISPGDSGSGANTLLGDTVGAHREAAGILTHLYVDFPPFKTGTGVMAGTRATSVSATLANGQLVPYPAPVPGAP